MECCPGVLKRGGKGAAGSCWHVLAREILAAPPGHAAAAPSAAASTHKQGPRARAHALAVSRPTSHTAHRETEIKERRLAFTHCVAGLLGRGRVRGGLAVQQLLPISHCKAAVSGHQLLVEAAYRSAAGQGVGAAAVSAAVSAAVTTAGARTAAHAGCICSHERLVHDRGAGQQALRRSSALRGAGQELQAREGGKGGVFGGWAA